MHHIRHNDLLFYFDKINLSFHQSGEACLTFANDNMISYKLESNILDIDSFINELEQNKQLERLNHFLHFVSRLMRHTDNNFEDKSWITASSS